jgi:DNA repair protein RadB
MPMLQRIPTGSVSIDRALEGGLNAGSVTLVYGEAETGKTTLAVQCAISCARHGYKTLFVDCDGTFSARRLSDVASVRLKKIVDFMIVMRPESFREQTAVIDRLSEYVTRGFGLVVVDTFTSLYRLRVAESPNKTFELNRELNRQAACLAQTARISKIAVLATSQVRSIMNDADMGVEPVGTRVLRFWADTIVLLKPSEGVGLIRAVLEKTSKMVRPSSFALRIDRTGIHDT